jgi:hypothetical protein
MCKVNPQTMAFIEMGAHTQLHLTGAHIQTKPMAEGFALHMEPTRFS